MKVVRSHPYNPQAEQHWRDLFVYDLRSLIDWDARNGNPELFKAVSILDKQYKSYSVEQHDLAIQQAEREKVLKELETWRVQKVSNIRNPCSLENTNSAFGELEGKLKELRRGKDGE
jgi:hypothetical protein